MNIHDIISSIEQQAPIALQEGFDNSGLLVGDSKNEVQKVLLTLDVTEAVLDEALRINAGLIISHHPLLFKGLKHLREEGSVNRILLKAIRNNIAIYAAHTNLDKVTPGVSTVLADKLGLVNQRILVPERDGLSKLITFIPHDHVEPVADALFQAGAGRIGNYDSCSFQSEGEGTFRALDKARPFLGEIGQIHREKEVRLEAIVPNYLKGKVLFSLKSTHPYEEVAFDWISLANENPYIGLGIVGDLHEPMSEEAFLSELKDKLTLDCIRHTAFCDQAISRVALCGGSGSDFLRYAKRAKAQVYISGDFKYHQFFDAENEILIADIGHHESEIYALDLIKALILKKMPNFAVHLSKINTNPINYF